MNSLQPCKPQAAQTIYGNSLEFEFYKKMYENKYADLFFKFKIQIRNKNDSTCVCVVCFTVCSLLFASRAIWKSP